MAPVTGRRVRVVTAFRAPRCRYCAGHRGIVFAGTAGLPVVAVQPGVVVFRGLVAGRRWLVVRRSDGLTVVYGGFDGGLLGRPSFGATVAAGDEVGVADTTLYVGVRRGDTPVDPASVMCLGATVGGSRRVARLLPADSL